MLESIVDSPLFRAGFLLGIVSFAVIWGVVSLAIILLKTESRFQNQVAREALRKLSESGYTAYSTVTLMHSLKLNEELTESEYCYVDNLVVYDAEANSVTGLVRLTDDLEKDVLYRRANFKIINGGKKR